MVRRETDPSTDAGSTPAGPTANTVVEPSTDPRTRLLGALTHAIGEAIASGDTEGARIAHEAIGKLLAVAGAPSAHVIPIARARKP